MSFSISAINSVCSFTSPRLPTTSSASLYENAIQQTSQTATTPTTQTISISMESLSPHSVAGGGDSYKIKVGKSRFLYHGKDGMRSDPKQLEVAIDQNATNDRTVCITFKFCIS